MTSLLYALRDPRSGEYRYIGKTDRTASARLAEHIYQSKSKRSYVNCWVSSLISAGVRPELEVLVKLPKNVIAFWERAYIAAARKAGVRLSNLSDGGEGPSGVKHTLETRKKMSASHTGKPSPMLGKTHSEETKKKIGLSLVGRIRGPYRKKGSHQPV